MNRRTGDLINKIPSMCDHNLVRVNKYPRDQDYVFESCSTCQEIYVHNINSGESFSVHKGSKIVRMCDDPDGSLLVMNRSWKLCKLDWDKTQDGAQLVLVQLIPKRTGKTLLILYYVECHDILMCNMVDDKETKDYEIITMKLGKETIIWRLFGPVEGHVFKPIAITCGPEGNAYFHDPGNIRILKINSHLEYPAVGSEREDTFNAPVRHRTKLNFTARKSDQHLLRAEIIYYLTDYVWHQKWIV